MGVLRFRGCRYSVTRPALTLTVAMALVSGCGIDTGGGDDSDSKSTASPLSRAKSATVIVLNHAGNKTYQSSGVVYDTSRGLVLTSATAVWDRDSLEVETSQGRKLKSRLVARSPCGDIAVILLDPKPPGLTAVHVGRSAGLKVGQRLTALGFVAGEGGTYRASETTGTTAATDASVSLDKTLPAHPSLVEHQAPVAATLAGGPLVDSHGNLAGINSVLNTYGDAPDAPADLSFAASSDYVKSRVAELKPTTHAFYEGWEAEHECHNQFQDLVRKHRGTMSSEPMESSHSSMGSDDSGSKGKDDSMKDSDHMKK
jgi:S1-C subfamily serine protease